MMRFPLIILASCFLISMQFYALSTSASHLPVLTDSISADCKEPITWRIGSIDPHFKLNEEILKYLMKDVQKLWIDSTDNSLIKYNDSGDVAIHLIYSNDQKITDAEKHLSEQIRKMKRRYYSMKLDFQKVSKESKNKLPPSILEYEEQINENITQYNNSFDNPRSIRNANYFEAGSQKEIYIYHFESIDNLRLLLAHEFGHAIGLNHTKNPLSVMYHKIKLQNDKILRLTPEDNQAIQNRCISKL